MNAEGRCGAACGVRVTQQLPEDHPPSHCCSALALTGDSSTPQGLVGRRRPTKGLGQGVATGTVGLLVFSIQRGWSIPAQHQYLRSACAQGSGTPLAEKDAVCRETSRWAVTRRMAPSGRASFW